jgi:chromosome segregation ATPase
MKIPTKFRINTEDFKIYFDNKKKTHVCENVETGEKTNIGVLGILMQMGILKPVEERTEESIKSLSERLNELEAKVNDIMKNIDGIVVKKEEVEERVEKIEEEKTEEKVEEKPKSEIKERIMKKVLEKAEEEKPEEVIVEDEEELKTWMEI